MFSSLIPLYYETHEFCQYTFLSPGERKKETIFQHESINVPFKYQLPPPKKKHLSCASHLYSDITSTPKYPYLMCVPKMYVSIPLHVCFDIFILLYTSFWHPCVQMAIFFCIHHIHTFPIVWALPTGAFPDATITFKL